jgi:hypothetical protein
MTTNNPSGIHTKGSEKKREKNFPFTSTEHHLRCIVCLRREQQKEGGELQVCSSNFPFFLCCSQCSRASEKEISKMEEITLLFMSERNWNWDVGWMGRRGSEVELNADEIDVGWHGSHGFRM